MGVIKEMGNINRVINIVVLALAIAAVVFAVQLKDKTEKIVKNHKNLAAIVKNVAKALAEGSGSGFKEADIKLVTHKGTGWQGTLEKALLGKVDLIMTQRDFFAGQFVALGGDLELKDIAIVGDFKDIEKYNANVSGLEGKVKNVQERIDGTASQLTETASIVGTILVAGDLKNNEKYKEALAKFNTDVEDTKKRKDSYQEHIGSIQTTLGIDAADLNGENYASNLDAVDTAVQEYKSNFEKVKSDLAAEAEKTKVVQDKLDSATQKTEELSGTIASRDKKINELEKIIFGTEKKKEIIKAGDPKVLAMMKGKIVDIDKKWDFVVIDMGSEFTVTQHLGGKDNVIKAPLLPNKELVVYRSAKSGKPQYIGRIKVVQIYGKCAIANLLPAKGVTKEALVAQVGDKVQYGREIIEAAKKAVATDNID